MRALITGITGQDGSYLAELLLSKGYEVHGIIRRTSTISTGRIDHIFDRLTLHHGDVTDSLATARIVETVQPNEVYNLAGQSHVKVSFEIPDYTMQSVGLGTLNVLEACRQYAPGVRFYQASSSEMFGSECPPQSEATRFHPRSPYGAAKVYAHHITVNYREAYGMHASCGILFNHESPRRGETFVTRKIAIGVAAIAKGRQKTLRLGNLSALRDWGYASDYVEAMWLMLQQPKPDDYVIATGVHRSVGDFVARAFAYVGLNWEKHVVADNRYFRPSEVDALRGDASKAMSALGWKPRVGFNDLVEMMVEAEMRKP